MAKALVKKGVSVTAVAMDYEVDKSIGIGKWLETNYGKVIYIKTLNHNLALSYVVQSLVSAKKNTIVHLNSLFAPTSFIIGILTMVLYRQKKIVWSVRGELSNYALSRHQIRKKIQLAIIRLFSKRICYHATSDQETADIHKHFPVKKIINIPNLIEMPSLMERNIGNPYFLYIGRIHPIKKLDALITALGKSSQFSSSTYVLKVAGDSNTKYGLQLQARVEELNLVNKVEFIGKIHGKAKAQLYADARFTILPSESENFGNVVLESLCQATPAIASKGTPWEILEKRKAGFWVESDPENLRKALEQAMALTDDVYNEYRQAAYSLAKNEFDIDANINRWQAAYQEVIQQA